MATLLARGGAFANHAVAISAGVPTAGRMSRLVSLSNKDEQLFDSHRHPTSSIAMASTAPTKSRMLAVSSLSGAPQVRFAHTDVAKVPDFSDYRKKSTISPSHRSRSSEMDRKSFTYAILFSGAVVVTYSAKAIVHSLVSNLAPNAKTLAESTIEVNLSTIPEGKNVVFKWRNKPLFVRHRTVEEIERERSVNVTELRDPEEDEKRVQKDEWLILVGVCTHLGCVPIANAGDFGGYYCPCHGSHYDGSGRIRKGPAPANLEIPEYSFLDDDTILVG